MTNEQLQNLLKNITLDHIQDMGEDVNGNPIFALKLSDKICSIIIGDMDINDFPEWKV